MKNKLMISGSAIALVATFGAHQALAGNGNEAFVTQDGSFNNAEIDQADANFAGVGLETRPFLQEGNGNDLSVIQQDTKTDRGPRVAAFTPAAAMRGERINGFQLGTANALTVEQQRTLPTTTNNVNWVGTLWQDGNLNVGTITQEAISGWNVANLRQTGNANIATLVQDVEGTGQNGKNRLAIGFFNSTSGTNVSQGGAVQDGTFNVMQIEQVSVATNDTNQIDLASQIGTVNVMNITQNGSNSALSFGDSGSAHQFADSLGLTPYVSLQEGGFNFLTLDMLSTATGQTAGGILFSTRQLGQGNTASVSLSGTLTEFALNQDGSLNSLDGIATGDNNDLAVNQVGVDVNVPAVVFLGFQITPAFTIPGGLNDASFFVDGNSNEMLIDQRGNANDALVEIDGDSNKSPVRQTGNSNDAFVDIFGNSNSAPVIQSGSRNDAELVIDGNMNTASSTQIGNDNFTRLNIDGNDNSSTLSSNGNLNTILGTVEGNDNTSTVTQNGNGNTAVFEQIGNFNIVSIMQ
ncbi:Curlin associated repeat-containing protein [Roseinatronobacter thiooxidans]|uniref:Curlin associated repeat-containing protein n=1 Tax=Roseinatronobacter thiooxidans TaxID=121821 RepID=A0A2W7PWZ0_9RHOB|nr:hypothetical protein [Roseinatronobacter thiooxidans]PZX38340.1 Curlin associated repeat-containing protein [Roseinatronobacter thiooxidans]